MLYVIPPVIILACWAKGARTDERRVLAPIAVLLWAAFLPVMAVAIRHPSELAQGSAYALAVMATGCMAMLLHHRRAPGEDGPGTAGPLPPQPDGPVFDWNDFERRFWAEVRRKRDRVPAGRR